MALDQPEDDLPTTRPLYSAPPAAPALTAGQLGKLRDIAASFALLSRSDSVHPVGKRVYESVTGVLSAFISECEKPPTPEELARDLESRT